MKRLLTVLALWAGATTASAQVGQKANLDVVQWMNTPPLAAENLQGRAILVEVFRTW